MTPPVWDETFVPTWNGLPKGSASCSVVPLCQSTLKLLETELLLPGRPGVTSRRPSLSFLITRENGQRALFDLGVPSDWLSWLPEADRKEMEEEFEVEITGELHDLLLKGGPSHAPVSPDEIDWIIISHQHFDHTGSPTSFPNAHLILGPGEAAQIPSLASLPPTRITSLSWSPSSPPLATFPHSHDLFGDGSLVLLDANGHTPGHIAALVRTNPDEYVLLFADGCHHHKLHSLHPGDEHYRLGVYRCAGDPEGEAPTRSYYEDYTEAGRMVQRMRALERREDVMVVMAHNEVLWEQWGGGQEGWGPELKGWRHKGLKMK